MLKYQKEKGRDMDRLRKFYCYAEETINEPSSDESRFDGTFG